MAKFSKTSLVALLAAGLCITAAQADPKPQDVVTLAALTPDGETQLLPQGKLEKIAAVSVPEVAPLAKIKVLPAYPALAQKARNSKGKVFGLQRAVLGKTRIIQSAANARL